VEDDGALYDYQNKRDALTANGYALTLSTARLAPLTPRLEAFYRAAADQPEAICRIFGVIGGSDPIWSTPRGQDITREKQPRYLQSTAEEQNPFSPLQRVEPIRSAKGHGFREELNDSNRDAL
jgi:hypothetical protein